MTVPEVDRCQMVVEVSGLKYRVLASGIQD